MSTSSKTGRAKPAILESFERLRDGLEALVQTLEVHGASMVESQRGAEAFVAPFADFARQSAAAARDPQTAQAQVQAVREKAAAEARRKSEKRVREALAKAEAIRKNANGGAE